MLSTTIRTTSARLNIAVTAMCWFMPMAQQASPTPRTARAGRKEEKMNSLENVKVGDTLFVSNGIDSFLEAVERLTQTLVITKHHRFAKNSGKLLGGACWAVFCARLATEEDVAMVRRKQMVRRCENIDFSLIPSAQLEQILEIANKKEQ